MTTTEKIEKFVEELRDYIREGKSLREISQITYTRREAGENIPYMSILTKDRETGEVVTLAANPTSKQKELKAWFSQPRDGKSYLQRGIYVEKGVVDLKM